MRRALPFTLFAVLVVLIVASMAAGGSKPGSSAASGPENRSPLTLAPAPSDFALAEVSFKGAARGQIISGSSLQVSVSGPLGDDYLAAAALRLGTKGVPRALVLLVNRPSALLDPVSVHVQLTSRRALGPARVRTLTDPFTRPRGAGTPALCDLSLHGSPLSTAELRPLQLRGRALAGFGAASAVAQAYDVVCGLPYATFFARAIRHPPAPPLSPVAPGSPSSPVQPPSPPVGRLPGEGCKPVPGYACPGVVRSVAPAAAVGGKP